ncbi:MAG: GNAT family N-acetyltransferase [Chloroflexi bacterium]|nr:GNAT family N-acetyltransferase [Chloroflexota bacterium]
MIVIASPEDGAQIDEITAKTDMFNAEEVQCVADIWLQHLQLGPEASGYSFYVAKEAEMVLGFVCVGPRGLTDRVYDLYWIVVDPAAQRHGVGRKLLEAAEQSVRTKNGRILVIETSGTEKYTGTRAFYLSCGYLHEATLHDLYANGDDLCIYTKRLN